jgi:sugar-specific transcriptional regulator TrmB
MEAANTLRALGLEGKLADTYVFVYAHGVSRPTDVAQGLALGRTDAYRILEELAYRGFLAQTLHKTTRYEAVPVARVFDREIIKTNARRAELLRGREAAIHAFEALTRKETLKPATITQNIYGRREGVARMVQMLRDARVTWRSITTHPGTLRLGADEMGLRDIYRERATEGLDVRSIVTLNDQNQNYFRSFVNLPNVGVRHLTTDAVILSAFSDHSELILWLAIGDHADMDSPHDIALFTNAPDVVRAHEIFFEALSSQAHPMEALLEAGTTRHARPFPDPTNQAA